MPQDLIRAFSPPSKSHNSEGRARFLAIVATIINPAPKMQSYQAVSYNKQLAPLQSYNNQLCIFCLHFGSYNTVIEHLILTL